MAEQDRSRAKVPGAAADAKARGASSGTTARAGTREGSKVPWVALGVAAALTVWQVIYSITLHTVAEASQEVYTSVSLFVSLILAVGALVLGIVARSQHHTPRWPATAAIAIGVYVFVVCVAAWVGGLMASPV